MRPAFGDWRSLVAHFVRDEGVGGSNPLSPTKFEKPAQRAGFFASVVLTDGQHRFREIQPYCTPLPGAAQSALPGLRVQRCLRAGRYCERLQPFLVADTFSGSRMTGTPTTALSGAVVFSQGTLLRYQQLML